jgi:methionyl-tRNA synthetase
MRYYVTTPIYYVNAEPHLGHAYTTVAADILARFHRQRGDDVFFLTGTDEHGTKIAQAAEARGLTPREHVDEMAPVQGPGGAARGDQRLLHPHDRPRARGVRAGVRREAPRRRRHREAHLRRPLLHQRCEGFWYERDLAPDGTCPQHGIKPTWLEEENYYFLLSRYQDRLAEFFRANPDWVKPASRYNEALSFIEQGLEDISISRQSITWGVRCPGTRSRSSTSGSTR